MYITNNVHVNVEQNVTECMQPKTMLSEATVHNQKSDFLKHRIKDEGVKNTQ